MKKYFFYIIALISSYSNAFATNDAGILGNSISQDDLKKGNVHIDDIPKVIRGAIDFGMSIAGTIAVIFIIIGAYQILFGSIEQDKSKGKNTIVMAIIGFAIASLAWFIIKLIIDNLSSNV
ncbi:MAG: pilin [Candidatus Gracilibacteria bacterium]|nr:pilin [Candidatus Gracilibacteria bacterium]